MGRVPLLLALVGFGALLTGLPLMNLATTAPPCVMIDGTNHPSNNAPHFLVPVVLQSNHTMIRDSSGGAHSTATDTPESIIRKAAAIEEIEQQTILKSATIAGIVTNSAANQSSSSPGKFVIFYNAYVNPKSTNTSLQIMKEQMEQVYNSSHRNATVYYNILGRDIDAKSDGFCKEGMDCRKMRFIHNGDEVETLQDLYNHCIAHTNDTVIYLHDKGSFNGMGRNHAVRRLGTLSSTSEACRSIAHNNSKTCNICVSKFHFLPNAHTQGNLWTAQCSYISTLIPPKEYELKRRVMFTELKHNHKVLTKFGCFYTLLDGILLKRPYTGEYGKHLALGRYAMETWVMSGPYSRPCHTIPGAVTSLNYKTWKATELWEGVSPTPIRFSFEMTTGWYRIYGRLYEYQTLYNGQMPPRDSWFWERMPFADNVEEETIVNCTGLRYRAAKQKTLPK